MKSTTNIQILEQPICLKLGTSLGISSTDPSATKEALYSLTTQRFHSSVYIEQHDMLYETMTVLEYLMFASRHLKKSSVLSRQQELFELLISLGLGYISLTPIQLLTPQEKMILLLWTALSSNEAYVIYDITDYEFDMEFINCIKEIIRRLKKQTTTLIIGTMQPKLIGICLEETLFIHENQILYYGSVNALQHSMDRVLYVIKHTNYEELVPQLVRAFPMYEISSGNQLVFVMRKKSSRRDDAMFFETLAKEKITPDQIKINHGRIENSFQELIEFNAIHK